METIRGTVTKVKIIKMSERPLVYFKVDDVSCLIASHSLTFLADVAEGSRIAVAGEFNSRKQFVCRKYAVLGKPQIVIEYERSKYPRKKRMTPVLPSFLTTKLKDNVAFLKKPINFS